MLQLAQLPVAAVSKSFAYTTVSVPPTTSLTDTSTSTEPEIACKPVFRTVTLTSRVPSPIFISCSS